MSRPLRIRYPGAIYHAMNRGVDRRLIFTDDVDRTTFLDGLADSVEKYELVLHGYALMGTHYHLQVETPHANLSQAMHAIDGLYSQRFNRRHGRIGPLFGGRYKGILVQSDRYFLAVSRYIHRNPAEIAPGRPLAEYAWSSYGAFLGRGLTPTWLTTGRVLAAAGGVAAYRHFVDHGAVDEEFEGFYARRELPPVVGDAAFRQWAGSLAVEAAEIELGGVAVEQGIGFDAIDRVIVRRLGVPAEELRLARRGRRAIERMLAISLAAAESKLPFEVVARAYGFTSPSSLRGALGRFERLRSENPAVDALYEELAADLREVA